VNNRDRVITLAILVLCLCYHALSQATISLFLPIIRDDLGLSFTQAGSISATALLVYACMQVPAGFLADRLSTKIVFSIGILGTTILFFTFGLISKYWQGVANEALSGAFRALVFAPGMVLITSWFSPKRRATAMGLYLIGTYGGTTIMNLAGPLLVEHFNWRSPFMSFAAIGIIAALGYIKFGKETPQTSGKARMNLTDILPLIRSKIMWLCGIIQFVRLAILQGISFWLPSFLIEDRGISLQVTGLIIALRYILLGPSNVLGGYVADRLKNPTLVIGVSVVFLGITTALLSHIDSIAFLILVIVVNSLFVQLYFGPLFSIPIEYLGERTQGTATGLSNFFACLGGFVFVYLLGYLKDITSSFDSGFYAIAGLCVISLIATFVLSVSLPGIRPHRQHLCSNTSTLNIQRHLPHHRSKVQVQGPYLFDIRHCIVYN
jgi:sugar phosphate permease